jgi:hypothetical protein
MFKSFRREILISFAAIFSFFLIAGVLFYLLNGDLSSQTQKIITAKILVNNRAVMLDALAALKSDAVAAAGYKKTIDRILVSQDDLLNYQKWLEGLARVHNLGSNFAFSGQPVPSSAGAPGHYDFSLTLIGSVDDILGFLKDAEYGAVSFLTSFNNLNFTATGGSDAVSLGGDVYFK